ncbi:AraC family transcriptional regulator [Mucilaginibacter sp. dw_454]|uniref:AraC family transcriptional regulator n=1 Tax=Mucilaginibacter sp. dw_454 TaxID=2720079 RepID=UPI001BD4D6D8|nr:AraC family transcriptional regulator [Mucilaginibacter sp. dw_454]
MHITFTSLPDHLSYLDLSYPKEFGSAAGLQKRESTVNAGGGQIRLKEVWFEGACLLSTDFKMNGPCQMKLQCDSFCWLMSFVLSGEISTSFGPEREKIQMKKKEYQMLYSDALVAELLVAKPSTAFTICLTRRFVRKLLGKDLLPDRFEGGGEENLTLLTMNEPTGSRLGILVKEMMQAGQPEYIRRIFLESKILEMLSLQLERIENKQAAVTSFSQADIDKLHEARDIVEANIQTPCSLIELARKTGLNDFKLKKGFKSLFNQTVFGYLAQVRMDRAYLLLQQGRTVNEVSEAVGYKNPHHFSAAFKKRFDLLPRQIGRE